MLADFRFVQRMKNGDKETIEEFVREYYPVILNYCRYHTWNTEFAEDLTQDVFCSFFKALPSYRHEGKLLNYLYVIARNLCMSRYKDDVRQQDLEAIEDVLDEAVQSGASGSGDMEAVSERLDVEQAVRQLPGELREMVILYYFQGVKQREIARVCGIKLSLVKYRLRQAKERLRKSLAGPDMPKTADVPELSAAQAAQAASEEEE